MSDKDSKVMTEVTMLCGDGRKHKAIVIDGIIHSACGLCNGELLSDVEVVKP